MYDITTLFLDDFENWLFILYIYIYIYIYICIYIYIYILLLLFCCCSMDILFLKHRFAITSTVMSYQDNDGSVGCDPLW